MQSMTDVVQECNRDQMRECKNWTEFQTQLLEHLNFIAEHYRDHIHEKARVSDNTQEFMQFVTVSTIAFTQLRALLMILSTLPRKNFDLHRTQIMDLTDRLIETGRKHENADADPENTQGEEQTEGSGDGPVGRPH